MQYGNSSTLNGIREDIYYLAKCNALSLSANDLNRIVNKYYLQLQDVVRSVNENFYMQVAISGLVIGDGTYTFPDGLSGTAPAYEKIKSIWVAFQPKDINNPLNSEFVRCNIIDPDSISDPSYQFSEPTCLMFGSFFTLLPLVTDVTKFPVIGGVKIYYIAENVPLTLDTDVPNIFPSFHDAITQGSLIDVNIRLGNDDASKMAQAIFAKRLKDIALYASNRLPDELGLVEGQDEGGGWEYSFGNTSIS